MAEHDTTPQSTAGSGATEGEESHPTPFRAPRAARLTTAVAAVYLTPEKRTPDSAPGVNAWIP
ncbi:hypothetical protein JCM4914_03770 [Streptomyces platensis subsp. malvinus]